jgi:dTDP-4-amino-4,6-dideoxygalactose transaminase
MTTAEGGAVIARDATLLETIRQARGHGMTSGTRQRLNARTPTYDVTMLGFNYRMNELQAAIGLVQLQKLAAWNEVRRTLVVQYRRALAEYCPSVTAPFAQPRTSSFHIMPIVLPAGTNRQEVIGKLRDNGIQTTIHYTPIHLMSLYRELFPAVRLPRTEDFAEREVTLPLHPRMDSETVERVATTLARAVQAEATAEAVP